MNSIWTDLLFLHGHLVRKEDLVWRSDAGVEEASEGIAKDKAHPIAPASPPSARGGLHWPRLSLPH